MAMVWVIDDEAATSDVLAAMLQEIGYETRVFNQAREALAEYHRGCADVVMTDIRMPGLDGLEFTRALREKDPRATIIILTGFPSVEDAVEAIKMGAADYMTKPFRLEEVRLRLLRVLEARDLQDRFRRNRMLSWVLIGSLPVWFILGILLAFLIARS
ncbi:MAG TPA: response regulator [Kiritimatiellia bacterium]|nr:response regulator [Kiritimatiellia bacterium]